MEGNNEISNTTSQVKLDSNKKKIKFLSDMRIQYTYTDVACCYCIFARKHSEKGIGLGFDFT